MPKIKTCRAAAKRFKKTGTGKLVRNKAYKLSLIHILETVVSQGSGKNAKIEGYAIGGKTATSQTLPRSANRYISSFLGFAPAEDPQILGLCIIHDPKGIYYGGTVAAPVIRGIFENILPYLGIEKSDVSDFSAEGN